MRPTDSFPSVAWVDRTTLTSRVVKYSDWSGPQVEKPGIRLPCNSRSAMERERTFRPNLSSMSWALGAFFTLGFVVGCGSPTPRRRKEHDERLPSETGSSSESAERTRLCGRTEPPRSCPTLSPELHWADLRASCRSAKEVWSSPSRQPSSQPRPVRSSRPRSNEGLKTLRKLKFFFAIPAHEVGVSILLCICACHAFILVEHTHFLVHRPSCLDLTKF